MARVASTGTLLPLSEAKTSLLDLKGNPIEFEEQKDGSFRSKTVEGDSYTYTYDLTPQTQLVTVSVTKQKKGEPKKEISAEEEKSLKEAKTIPAVRKK